MTPRLSIIVPALNEAQSIESTLTRLQTMRPRGAEVIVVDGGSKDSTTTLAAPLSDRIVHSPVGRARQMNAGAQAAQAAVLWFLHADNQVQADADNAVIAAVGSRPDAWGFFTISLSGQRAVFRIVEWAMNRRVRLTSVVTGDHGLFVHRSLFDRVGGFPELPLMEDVAISKSLRKICRPCVLAEVITTSSRRWENHGVVRTILLMWRLRLLYFLGVAPDQLAKQYRQAR